MTEAEETRRQRNKGTRNTNHLVSLIFPFFLVLLIAAATWKLTLGQRIIARGDLLLYFYPLRDYASQAIRELRLPLWNPYTFMGSPFLANSQAGFFYPFNILTAWAPVAQAVSWQIALHLLIATLGAYALARSGLKVGRLAAFATAIAFGLGGYLGAQVEHLNQLQVLAWLPLLLLAIGEWRVASDRNHRSSVIGRLLVITVIVTLQITAGHTQSLYICLVTSGIAALTQLATQFWTNRKSLNTTLLLRTTAPLLPIIIGVGMAALLCAVQLLPTLELSRESARAGGLPFGEAASFSWRPWVISRALLPTWGDPLFPEYIAYFGAAGLALAMLGVLKPSSSGGEGWVRGHVIAISLVVIGFILALGIVTPVFNVLYKFSARVQPVSAHRHAG